VAALPLLCGVLDAAAMAWPGEGKYLALGLGIFGAALGVVAYRRAARGRRLLAAGGTALAVVVALLAGVKIGLTLVALDKLGVG